MAAATLCQGHVHVTLKKKKNKNLILSVHWDPPHGSFTLQQYSSEGRRNNTDGSIGLPVTWPDKIPFYGISATEACFINKC